MVLVVQRGLLSCKGFLHGKRSGLGAEAACYSEDLVHPGADLMTPHLFLKIVDAMRCCWAAAAMSCAELVAACWVDTQSQMAFQ